MDTGEATTDGGSRFTWSSSELDLDADASCSCSATRRKLG
jgi:hypothetical protein